MTRRGWIAIGCGALFVAVTAASVLVSDSWSARDTAASTYSVEPTGCKALYMVLDQLGLPVKRLRRSLSELRRYEGVLVVIQPRRVKYSERETARLKEWVRNGNRLIIIEGFPPVRSEKGVDAELMKRLPAPKPDDGKVALARSFGLRLKRGTSQGRRTIPLTDAAFPYVRHISASAVSRWQETPSGWKNLAADEDGPLILSKRLGRGQVVAISDPSFLGNRHVSEEQNLKLALALMLQDPRPAAILFDEYHHGYIQPETIWHYVVTSSFAWIWLQLAIGLGLFFYSRRAQYAGRFRTMAAPAGRSTLEYVDSMAGIFRSCDAAPVALAAVLKRFQNQVTQRTVRRLANDQQAAGLRVHPKSATDDRDVDRLVKECQRVAESGGTPDEARVLAHRLAKARRQLLQRRL
ncbi:MAG: DUF4350 domain-containing protein [Thermodesulfobacteriota bacterium]